MGYGLFSYVCVHVAELFSLICCIWWIGCWLWGKLEISFALLDSTQFVLHLNSVLWIFKMSKEYLKMSSVYIYTWRCMCNIFVFRIIANTHAVHYEPMSFSWAQSSPWSRSPICDICHFSSLFLIWKAGCRLCYLVQSCSVINFVCFPHSKEDKIQFRPWIVFFICPFLKAHDKLT